MEKNIINSVKETEQLKSKSVLETGSSQSLQIILISCEGIQHLHLFYQAYSYKNLLKDPARQNTSLPQDYSDLEIAPFTDSSVTCSSGIPSLPRVTGEWNYDTTISWPNVLHRITELKGLEGTSGDTSSHRDASWETPGKSVLSLLNYNVIIKPKLISKNRNCHVYSCAICTCSFAMSSNKLQPCIQPKLDTSSTTSSTTAKIRRQDYG